SADRPGPDIQFGGPADLQQRVRLAVAEQATGLEPDPAQDGDEEDPVVGLVRTRRWQRIDDPEAFAASRAGVAGAVAPGVRVERDRDDTGCEFAGEAVTNGLAVRQDRGCGSRVERRGV